MPFESIRLITFDCYGTLVDWEKGMLAALRPLLSRDGHHVADLQILELYGEIEAELESGPYLPYRQVLAQLRGRWAAAWEKKFHPKKAAPLPNR